jgi:hypothetical protein
VRAYKERREELEECEFIMGIPRAGQAKTSPLTLARNRGAGLKK